MKYRTTADRRFGIALAAMLGFFAVVLVSLLVLWLGGPAAQDAVLRVGFLVLSLGVGAAFLAWGR
ncbi:hypothetical protein D5S17_28985 [Pseudonocardiaceae bacterium YIM PH 21723]|nr:hypothetical protein D5S17_28985 [Pseudonocardiaceae bacterium YIM PH 21723]